MKIRWKQWPVLLAAPFFPLFFIPLTGGGLNSLELNFVAALLLGIAALTNSKLLLNNPFFIYGVIIPWSIILMGYLVSSVFLGPRTSILPFTAQIVFLVAASGLAVSLEAWLRTGSKNLFIFTSLVIISYFIGLYMHSNPVNFWGIWNSVLNLEVWNLIVHARRAFNPDAFIGETIAVDRLANNHNRIAQQTFSLGYFVLTLSLLSRARLSELSFSLFASFSALTIILSLLLMSGQSMGQFLISVVFCSAASLIFKPTQTKLMLAACTVVLFAVLMTFLANTDFGQAWATRLSSGNIDTGRVVRWVFYWQNGANWTVIGEPNSLSIDPHNMLVTLFFETGVVGTLGFLLFCVFLISSSVMTLRTGYVRFGFAYLMAISTGLQTIFVMMIAGGYGFPGWAEMSKFSLFLLVLFLHQTSPKEVTRPVSVTQGRPSSPGRVDEKLG